MRHHKKGMKHPKCPPPGVAPEAPVPAPEMPAAPEAPEAPQVAEPTPEA